VSDDDVGQGEAGGGEQDDLSRESVSVRDAERQIISGSGPGVGLGAPAGDPGGEVPGLVQHDSSKGHFEAEKKI